MTARAALRARREHRLPGLRALPAHDRRRERRVRAQGQARQAQASARSEPPRRSSSCASPASAERKPSQLSGGQRQRVALARAIVNHPQVLLLDEPLGALDLKLRQEMQIELKRIQQEVGITFVYVTHDQEEALTMSDRLAVFNAGRIEQVGSPADVYEHPADRVRGRVRRRLERPRAHDERRASASRSALRRSASLRSSETPEDGAHTEAGEISGGRLRRHGHAICRRPRRGRSADGRQAEPRNDIRRGARGPWPPGPPRVAPRAHVRNRTGGRGGDQ